MPITHLTRLELTATYEAEAHTLKLQNGGQWALPEALPVLTGTAVHVCIEAISPEAASHEDTGWYEQAAMLRQVIYHRRGTFAGDSVQDVNASRDARGAGKR